MQITKVNHDISVEHLENALRMPQLNCVACSKLYFKEEEGHMIFVTPFKEPIGICFEVEQLFNLICLNLGMMTNFKEVSWDIGS